jgi:hypothetical protein
MAAELEIRVLVTGGTGLVGKAIEWNHLNTPKHPEAKFIFLSSADADLRDLSQTMACFQKHKPTHVIHLAAIVVRFVFSAFRIRQPTILMVGLYIKLGVPLNSITSIIFDENDI